MLPETAARVPDNTSDAINERIRQETIDRIELYLHASPGEITQRLQELDREWDTERTLETNASMLAFIGCTLTATVNPKWVFLPMAVTAFLFQHAVQGWCPPLPVLRRLGVRTQREIDIERFALKALRQDFQHLSQEDSSIEADQLLEAIEK